MTVERVKEPARPARTRVSALHASLLGDDDPAACLFRSGYGRLLFRELGKEEIDESPRPRPARGACQAHAQEEYQRLQHVGVPQPGVARYFVDVLLLGLAEFPDHGLDFASDALVRQVHGGRFVNKTGVYQRLIGLDERTDRGDQVAVQERPISAGAFTQSETESHDEVLAFEQKLLRDLNLGKRVLQILFGWRLVVGVRVLPRLLQIRTVAGAVERDLALLATALRADFSVHRRAKPLLSTLVTDRTGQRCFRRIRLFHGKSEVLPPRRRGRREGLLPVRGIEGHRDGARRARTPAGQPPGRRRYFHSLPNAPSGFCTVLDANRES